MSKTPQEAAKVDGSKEEIIRGLRAIQSDAEQKIWYYKDLLRKTKEAIRKVESKTETL